MMHGSQLITYPRPERPRWGALSRRGSSICGEHHARVHRRGVDAPGSHGISP